MKNFINIKIILSFLTFFLLFSPKMYAEEPDLTGRFVVLDAGHGGLDYGSMECSVPEKVVNLDIANKLKDLLIEHGAVVYMTREGDQYLTNRDRYTYANTTNGEILVSVHMNSSIDHSVNYTQGLYAKWKKDISLANTLHQSMIDLPYVTDGGLLQFASGVILKAEMPATIQETAFISNTQECARLSDGTGNRQQQIAEYLFKGIVNWFENNQHDEIVKPGNGNKVR